MNEPAKKIVVVEQGADIDSVTVQFADAGSESGILLPGKMHVRMSLTSSNVERLYQRMLAFCRAMLDNPASLRRMCEQLEKDQRAGIESKVH